MEISIATKLAHLKANFSFADSELEEIAKLYSGEDYDHNDPGIIKLKKISAELCEEWNNLYTGINPKSHDNKRKKALLKLLFPGLPSNHGSIRRNMHLVIGLVEVSPYTFINVGADFGENTLVKLGVWSQLGPNFSIDEAINGKAKTIIVEKDAWLGGKVKVKAGTTIGENSVVGAGAYVNEDVPKAKLSLGRPASPKKDIVREKEIAVKDFSLYSQDEIDLIRSHYKKIGHGLGKGLVNRIFTGKPFSTLSISLGMLYLYTHGLCMKLDNPHLKENERQLIIDQLFPIHGKNIKIGRHFFLDLCGVVSLGDNVTIEDNVCLGGLIKIGSNVTIGSGSLLFSSNHPLSAVERKVGFHKGLGLSIPIYLTPIQIGDGVTLGKNTCIAPFANIKENIEDNMLVLQKGTKVALP